MIEANPKNDNLYENLKRILTKIVKQIGIVFLYLILAITFTLLFQKGLLNNNNLIVNLANILVNLLVLVVFIFIFRKTIVPDFDEFKKSWKQQLKKSYKYWLIGLALMVISNILISLQIDMPTNEELNRTVLYELPLYSLIAMIIIAPITEELMTRVILKDLTKKPYVFIIFSGLIFGTLHMISATSLIELLYIIPYGALGSSFAYMYYKTNNIWNSIFFHSLHNLIAILLIFIGV